jgi:hypothetical protein
MVKKKKERKGKERKEKEIKEKEKKLISFRVPMVKIQPSHG